MFKDDYRKDMDKLELSGSARLQIKARLEEASQRAKPRNPAIPWRVGFAVVAAAAIVLSVMFGRIDNKPPVSEISDRYSTLITTASYDSIYDKLNELRHKTEQEEVIYEYATDFATDDGAVAATGGTSKPAQKNEIVTYSASTSAKEEYSQTTTQVEGVDEADIVKTDGRYIYTLSDSTLRVLEANSGKPRLVQTVALPEEGDRYYLEMYLSGERLVVLGEVYTRSGSSIVTDRLATMDMVRLEGKTEILIYDVSKPDKAALVGTREQSGSYNSSRMIGDKLYVISNHTVNLGGIDKKHPETFVPTVSDGNTDTALEADCVLTPSEGVETASYLVACSYNSCDSELISAVSVLSASDTVYSSTDNIITAVSRYDPDSQHKYYTSVSRFSLSDGEISYIASGMVPGTLINQFAIDEHNGYFRFVTTEEKYEITEQGDGENSSVSIKRFGTSNGLYVLDKNLDNVGSVDSLAEGERVYSVRFMGDIAYFVTFRQVDPLFSVDVSDPKAPKVIGELKIPGFSEYLYPYGQGLMLGIGQDADEKTGRTNCLKLSMFDVSDPSAVTEQDKLLLSKERYSEALYNHKACIVHSEKNLIGFAVSGSGYNKGDSYVLFSYENGFKELCRIDCSDHSSKRGLFIGDVFYIVGQKSVISVSLLNFEIISTFNF